LVGPQYYEGYNEPVYDYREPVYERQQPKDDYYDIFRLLTLVHRFTIIIYRFVVTFIILRSNQFNFIFPNKHHHDYYDVPKYEKELDKSNTVYDQEQERDKYDQFPKRAPQYVHHDYIHFQLHV
jgi:hypothetical protein